MSQPGGPLFVVSGKYVLSLDRSTGRPIWQRKLPAAIFGSGLATLAVDGNEVFVGRNGYVYCLDARSGQVLWERGVGSSGWLVAMATANTPGTSGGAAPVQQHASIAAAAAAST